MTLDSPEENINVKTIEEKLKIQIERLNDFLSEKTMDCK